MSVRTQPWKTRARVMPDGDLISFRQEISPSWIWRCRTSRRLLVHSSPGNLLQTGSFHNS